MVFEDNVLSVTTRIKGSVTKALTGAAIEWRNGIVQSLTGDKHGIEYHLPASRGNGMYRASAPGESPASVTGALRTSYHWTIESDTTAIVGSDMPYAETLEKGNGHIAPRPHIQPGYELKKESIMAALTKDWG